MAIGAGTRGLIGGLSSTVGSGLSSTVGSYNTSRKATQAAAEKAKRMEDIQNWLNSRMDKYRKQNLAYQIEKLQLKRDVPMSIVDNKLRPQYGSEVVAPVINLLEDFGEKFKGYSDELDEALKQWSIKNNFGSDKGSEKYWENFIAKKFLEEQEPVANKIIDEALKGYNGI